MSDVLVKYWRLAPDGWRGRLRIVMVADVHAGYPQMSPARIGRIVAQANGLGGDVIVLLGDYVADHPFQLRRIGVRRVADILAGLAAPLGVWAVLGNHDWKDDPAARLARRGPPRAQTELEAAGLPVLVNRAVRLGGPAGFWLAGVDSQRAFRGLTSPGRRGADDLAAALAQVTDSAPVILLAHEPDIFARVPARVALTLSGHTHGGQITLFGRAIMVPSDHGTRYAYGHLRDGARHLVVSGGLGCSGVPLRLGVPPELTVVDLG